MQINITIFRRGERKKAVRVAVGFNRQIFTVLRISRSIEAGIAGIGWITCT
ncbi:MAG TPA: hypothetical protein VFR58_09900 [Flavisolibacter sp.]|nr:hypothetical protein [Flavisolibacter sp.]